MSATVIKGAFLMTENGLKKDYGLRMEEDRIVQIAPNDKLLVNEADKLIEVPDEMILPGFVNGHNHMYGFLSHGITAEAMVTEFESFLDDFWWPYVEDRLNHGLVEATARWACAEMWISWKDPMRSRERWRLRRRSWRKPDSEEDSHSKPARGRAKRTDRKACVRI